MAEDMGEKTEKPTSRRRGEARRRGQIGKSVDLSAAILLISASILLAKFGGRLFSTIGAMVHYALSVDGIAHDPSGKRLVTDLWLMFGEAAKVTIPIMGLMMVAAYLSGLLQVGWMFTLQPLKPNFARLNLIGGLGKFIKPRNFVKGGLDLSKFIAVTSIVAFVLIRDFDKVIALSSLELMAGIVTAGKLIVHLIIWCLVFLLVLGLLDIWYQKWQVNHDLRMTKHEVKDERKAVEGDMETKARRLRMARRVAMQRLFADVPKADVIVTNPTHFAVALKYDSDKMNAPRVIAKGADYLALKIRYLAVAHGVPIVERPPLARALYAQVNVGQEIPAELYEAVAEVLAYIYRLEGRMAS